MLLRAYRLTDRMTLILLKATGAFSALTADGLLILLGNPTGRRTGILGLLGAIGAVLWRLLLALGTILAPVGNLILRILGIGVASTASGYQGAMARRAARSEIRSAVQEDPLRARNRALSVLLVIALATVIGVVLWATQPRPGTTIAALGNPDAALITNATQTPTGSAPVAIATAIPTATQLPAVLQSRGTVAYSLRENGQLDLWAVPITSRTPIRLTNDPADERDPVWSPDGRQLAYASNRDGNWNIYTFDFETQQTRTLTVGLNYEGAPSWSPDGSWIVYETYQNGNMDIYALPVTDQNASVSVITSDPAGDFRPAWSPDGRQIAFVSWRSGNGDIFIVSLDAIDQPFNLTSTFSLDEDYPAWSPDGQYLAYSAVEGGIEKVFVKTVAEPNTPPQLIGRGRAPAWSPDGTALIAAVDVEGATDLTVYPFGGSDAVPQIYRVPPRANHPSWASQPLPSALVNAGGLPPGTTELYVETTLRSADGLYRLGALTNNIQAPIPSLSDRVNDSFNALRARVNELAARDFLGRLDETFWDINEPLQPGEELRNWHKTGRAFSINRQAALVGFPPEIQVFREVGETEVKWRVFVRVGDEAQFGQRGEPLRGLPWDFDARVSSDAAAYEAGGKVRSSIPEGYFVDLTEIAADYGWLPYPAGSSWRANFNAINYWMFYKPDGLTWLEAMREVWPEGQLLGFLPTPTPSVATAGG